MVPKITFLLSGAPAPPPGKNLYFPVMNIPARNARNRWVTGALALLAMPAILSAFNPIHDASYDLEPATVRPQRLHLSGAAIIDDRNTDVWQIPVSLAFRASPSVELGAGIRTAWGSGTNDHVPFLVFGGKWQSRSRTSYQADLLVPAHDDRDFGLSLAAVSRFHHFDALDSRLALRLGFLDALVYDRALAAFEVGWYPVLMPNRSLSFELGLIGSSQTRDFEGHLAMDIQPALIVAFGRHSRLLAGAALGLAGDAKERLRAKAQIDHGF
jgi:hypothetical protein